jgi:hypothetical protein
MARNHPGFNEHPAVLRGEGHGKGGIKKSHEGELHRDLGVPQGRPIPASKLRQAAHSPDPAVRKRAVFAENAKKWRH